MHTTSLFALALLGALALPAAADIPADGVLVASQTSFGSTGYAEHLYIDRIKPTGIEQVFTIKAEPGWDYGWTDAHTLWIMGGGMGTMTLQRIVDGAPAATVQVTPADWKLPKVPEILMPRLRITRSGEVWLEYCTKQGHVGRYGEPPCVRSVYLRADVAPFQVAATRPRGIDLHRVASIYHEGTPPPFPAAKTPAGYHVSLEKVTVDGLGESQKHRTLPGAVCTGPRGASATWPTHDDDIDYVMVPRKVTWLRTVPALARIEGKTVNPVGQSYTAAAYFLDCARVVDDVAWLDHGMWAWLDRRPVEEWQQTKTPTTDGTWSIYLEDKLIGTVPGTDLRLAPR